MSSFWDKMAKNYDASTNKTFKVQMIKSSIIPKNIASQLRKYWTWDVELA